MLDQIRASLLIIEVTSDLTHGNGNLAEDLRRSREELDETQRRLDTVSHDLRVLESQAVTDNEVIDALRSMDGIWDELFLAEQARIVALLVERVDVHPDGLEVRLRADGLRSLVAETEWGTEV